MQGICPGPTTADCAYDATDASCRETGLPMSQNWCKGLAVRGSTSTIQMNAKLYLHEVVIVGDLPALPPKLQPGSCL